MTNRHLCLLLTAALTATTAPGLAQPIPPSGIPVPQFRPDHTALASGYNAVQESEAAEITGSIIRPSDPVETSAEASATLKRGLDAIDNDIDQARSIRDSLPRGSLDRQVLTWAIATSGEKGVPSYEIAAAATELTGWPGLKSLRAHSERALYHENPSPDQVIAAFGATDPTTMEGAMILARALLANGQRDRARQLIVSRWHSKTLDTRTENLVLGEFDQMLTVKDHKRRMDMLLYHERVSQADRFASMGEAHSLFRARAAVIRNADNAGALLKAVDRSWHDDPSYLFARIEHLRHQDRYEEAAELLAQAPQDEASLIDPDAWWNERRIVARGLMDEGKPRHAYKVASSHSAESDVAKVDAEFHAGWYALRPLNDPATAWRHFDRIRQLSEQPISLSRAYYWMGRAAEAGGPGNARDYYAEAAQHSTTYYGQLAAAKLGRKNINVSYPSPSDLERNRFRTRQAATAIKRLQDAGHERLALVLYNALADELDSPGELALLAYMAEKNGDYRTALRIGKAAFYRGVDVAALAFPIGVIPATANISAAGKALAYAIARQESEFNKAAVSPADARGLLQLLPGTARGVASRHGLPYAPARLTQDAAYNATLGSHYLGEQIDDFGGSYILTFIGYNAGPSRAVDWIERYGDPRGKSIEDVVDWVERIPFPETRNYVQRVMENYQVYKARLGAQPDIVHDLRFGRN